MIENLFEQKNISFYILFDFISIIVVPLIENQFLGNFGTTRILSGILTQKAFFLLIPGI